MRNKEIKEYVVSDTYSYMGMEKIVEMVYPYLRDVGVPLLIMVMLVFIYYFDEIWDWVLKKWEREIEEENKSDADDEDDE